VTLLLTVIIIGAIIVAAGISAAFIGQTEIIVTGDADRANVARNAAQACGEEALFRLKTQAGYSGGTIDIFGLTCAVSMTGAGANRTITATASSDVVSKTVRIETSLKQNSSLKAKTWFVDSWSEVDP